MGVAALLVVIAGGGWRLRGEPARACRIERREADRGEAPFDCRAALPTDLSGDSAQDYFADGVTENLTTEISRIRDSFVIAHQHLYLQRQGRRRERDRQGTRRALCPRRVRCSATRTGCGSTRNSSTQNRAHLWADRFEEDLADLFELQDQVVLRLANTLGIELVKAEAERGARSKNPDAVDLTMRGWALARQWTEGKKLTRRTTRAARALFDQVLKKIDPDNADALAGEAYTYTNEYSFVRSQETDYDPKILGPADQAIAIAPDAPYGRIT